LLALYRIETFTRLKSIAQPETLFFRNVKIS